MARVTASEVKEIMSGCTTPDSIVDVFITAATEVVDKIFSGDTTMSVTLLKEVERWLTAHMISCTPYFRATTDEKLGDASVKYAGQFTTGLNSTSYGQMVLTLDISGKMSSLGKRAPTFYAIPNFDN